MSSALNYIIAHGFSGATKAVDSYYGAKDEAERQVTDKRTAEINQQGALLNQDAVARKLAQDATDQGRVDSEMAEVDAIMQEAGELDALSQQSPNDPDVQRRMMDLVRRAQAADAKRGKSSLTSVLMPQQQPSYEIVQGDSVGVPGAVLQKGPNGYSVLTKPKSAGSGDGGKRRYQKVETYDPVTGRRSVKLVNVYDPSDVQDVGQAPPPASVVAAGAKAKSAASKLDASVTTAERMSNNVIAAIDKAKGQVGFETAGFVGSNLEKVGWEPAVDLKQNIQTIVANIGFDRLQRMRMESPTGGALGQVAVQELENLQASIASLKNAQSPEQLRANLDTVKNDYIAALDAMRVAASMEKQILEERALKSEGVNNPDKSGPAAGTVEDGYRFKGGDPANPASWEQVK